MVKTGYRKRRKRFNKVIKKLADLYSKTYEFVAKIYYKYNCNIKETRMILNIM